MTNHDVKLEIRDINLSYLMLAQQMIREDKSAAVSRLGVSLDIANLLADLSNAQILKLASSPVLLMRLRFDDATILSALTHDAKALGLAQAHAAILMATQPMEDIR